MPINREDGRHWCAPDAETPGPDGTWTCPDDGVVWRYTDPDGVIREASEPVPEPEEASS